MSLVLAQIDDFAKVSAKPLDREQFFASACVALQDGKCGGRKLSLVLAESDDFAKTIKKSVDQAHFLIIEWECPQERFGKQLGSRKSVAKPVWF